MIYKARKAFTLIEILIAVMLTGMLTTFALAPVVVTVRRVVETQEEYSNVAALSRTINFIERDLASAMRMSSNVITIIDHESIGGYDDDILIVMSTSTTAQNLPSASLIYKVEEGGVMHNNVIPGLYRWVFPGRIPNTIKYNNLRGDDPEAQLVLPDVNDFCVEVPVSPNEDEWRKDYSGQLPQGLYIKIGRGSRELTAAVSLNNNEDEENLDELERIIVFP